MSKKKDKPQVINNIQELNLEIDYDKLAEAIVKSQKNSEDVFDKEVTSDKADSPKEKWTAFKRNVLDTVNNEGKWKKDFLPSSLASLIQLLFNCFALLFAASSPIPLCFGGRRIYDWIVGTQTSILYNLILIVFCFMMFLLLLLTALIFRGIANEMGREKDKHYIVSVFSGLISFAALIVALVALFKGVE